MPLTVDEKEIGGLALVRSLIEDGKTPAQIKAFLDALDEPEVPEAGEVAAEQKRLITLPTGHQLFLEDDGGVTVPGNYPPEVRRSMALYLREHPLEPGSVVLAEGECPPLPGDYTPSASEQLVTLMTEGRSPKGGLSAGAERALARSEGSGQLTIGDMPIPGDSLSLEEVRNALVVSSIRQSSSFTGETTLDGMPVPV